MPRHISANRHRICRFSPTQRRELQPHPLGESKSRSRIQPKITWNADVQVHVKYGHHSLSYPVSWRALPSFARPWMRWAQHRNGAASQRGGTENKHGRMHGYIVLIAPCRAAAAIVRERHTRCSCIGHQPSAARVPRRPAVMALILPSSMALVNPRDYGAHPSAEQYGLPLHAPFHPINPTVRCKGIGRRNVVGRHIYPTCNRTSA